MIYSANARRRIQRSIQQTSNEVFALMKQIVIHKPKSRIDFRQILQQHQQQQQQQQGGVALKLLKLDKEINLIEYHGIQKYMSTQLKSSVSASRSLSFSLPWNSSSTGNDTSSSSTSSTATSTDRNSNSNSNSNSSHQSKESGGSYNKKKAKVAFMITSEQRQTLMTEYKYTQKQIKSMRPNEAQIILHHSIYPHGVAAGDSNTDSSNDDTATDSDADNSWRIAVNHIIEREKQEEEKQRQQEQEHTLLQQQQNMLQEQIANKEKEQKVEAELDAPATSISTSTISIKRINSDILSIGFEDLREQENDNNVTEKNEHGLSYDHDNTSLLLAQGPDKINTTINTTNNEEIIRANNDETAETNGTHELWYEVVEVIEESSSSSLSSSSEEVIALYKSYEEAQECLNFKQDLSKKQKEARISSSSSSSLLSLSKKFVIRERKI